MPPESVIQSIAGLGGGAGRSAIPLGLCCAMGSHTGVRRCATTSGYRLESLRDVCDSAATANRLTACPTGRASNLMDARGVGHAVKRSDSTRLPQNRIPQGSQKVAGGLSVANATGNDNSMDRRPRRGRRPVCNPVGIALHHRARIPEVRRCATTSGYRLESPAGLVTSSTTAHGTRALVHYGDRWAQDHWLLCLSAYSAGGWGGLASWRQMVAVGAESSVRRARRMGTALSRSSPALWRPAR